MIDDKKVVQFSDYYKPEPVPEIIPEPEVVANPNLTAVPVDVWKGFSPETQADAIANDVTAHILIMFENMGIEPTDAETKEIYDALAKVYKRYCIEKEDSDGE
jgi:hypothetical protein